MSHLLKCTATKLQPKRSLLAQSHRLYTTLQHRTSATQRVHTPHTCSPQCPCQLLLRSITTTAAAHTDAALPNLHQHDTHSVQYDMEYTNDGWLFGQDPSKPCNDPVDRRLGLAYTIGMYGTLLWTIFMCYYKPNTSIRVWAREEALARGVFVPPVRPDLTDDDEI